MHPCVRGYDSVSTGVLLPSYKLMLLKLTTPGTEHSPLKEGRRWGCWSGISHPQSISSHLTVLPPSTNLCNMHEQVMFLKCHLPPLDARWTCFVSRWYDYLAIIFIPSTGLEDIITLTKSTQQALNENQQSLSLLNTEMSLMRKAVLQN